MDFIWQSFLLILTGVLLLRIAGRKSIAQMTLAQTIIMISMGTIIVQPIVEKSVIKTIIAAVIFVISVVLLEYFQLKFNSFEKFITGKSKIVINNGILDVQNLKKLRLTVDQLEMRLRNQGISNIDDIKTATIEPNGQLGFELKEDAKPLTVGEFKKLMNKYYHSEIPLDVSPEEKTTDSNNIFQEINTQQQQNSKYLQ